MRNDRKKHENECDGKLFEIEAKILKNHEIIKQQDEELLNMKNLKAHYKLQLKDLYLRVLKEESDLLYSKKSLFVEYLMFLSESMIITRTIREWLYNY